MTNEEWYLETDITKLPEYLKNSNGDVVKVEYELRDGVVYVGNTEDIQRFGSYCWFQLIYHVNNLSIPFPSTETEYNEYLKSKQ